MLAPGQASGCLRCHFGAVGMSCQETDQEAASLPFPRGKVDPFQDENGLLLSLHIVQAPKNSLSELHTHCGSGGSWCLVTPSHRLGQLCGWLEPHPMLPSSPYPTPLSGPPPIRLQDPQVPALHGCRLPTQPVSLRLLLPCPQQGQESWGQVGGSNLASMTLGKVDAPQFLGCKRRTMKSGSAPEDASRIK